ncbi:MAG: DNA polymerase III subunit delta' [Sedimentisphaerales bacterium]|nr:DNA polymerase III subunit delta' [Sedimentisphaerales bacterium]
MNLSEIFCQDKAVNSLQRAYACGRLPHAYIFAGADGVGKFCTAGTWSKLLLCYSPIIKDNFADSCGKCESCRCFEGDSHPDFHHIYKELIKFVKDAQKRKRQPVDLPIDVIREFLIDKVQTKPALSAAKVFIVSEAEKLNAASQNALLKVLEEPPAASFIILLCTKLDNLLPTTRSRCQIVRFGPLDEEKIIAHLVQAGINKNEAKFWARFTGGSIGQAQMLSAIEPSFYEIKKEFLKRICRCQLADSVDIAQWINSTASKLTESWMKIKNDTSKADIGRQIKKIFVQMVISSLDDAMKQLKAEKMINFDQAGQIQAIEQNRGAENCAKLIEDCFTAGRFIDASVNEKLVFERLLINFANSAMITN